MSPIPLHPEQTLLVWGNLAGMKGSGVNREKGEAGVLRERVEWPGEGRWADCKGSLCQASTLPMRSDRDRRPSRVAKPGTMPDLTHGVLTPAPCHVCHHHHFAQRTKRKFKVMSYPRLLS